MFLQKRVRITTNNVSPVGLPLPVSWDAEAHTCTYTPIYKYRHTHTEMAYCINEMSLVAKVTSMNEFRKVTVETVNGKWSVAMAIWEMGRAPPV